MTRIGLIKRVFPAVALAGACGLVGCQQLPKTGLLPASKPRTESRRELGKITSAQQADVQIAMGRLAEQQGDIAGAMAAYRAALKRDSRRADAYERLGVLHDKQGEFRDAAAMYRHALKLSPGNPDIYCDMGYSLYLQRNWTEAEMNFRQAIAVDRKHPRAHNNLGLLLARNGQLTDAVTEFRRGGSDPAGAHANVALVLSMERHWDDARKEYELALAADPSSAELKKRLDELDKMAGEPGRNAVEGTAAVRRARRSSPDQASRASAAPGLHHSRTQAPRTPAGELSFEPPKEVQPLTLRAPAAESPIATPKERERQAPRAPVQAAKLAARTPSETGTPAPQLAQPAAQDTQLVPASLQRPSVAPAKIPAPASPILAKTSVLPRIPRPCCPILAN
jgi:Flp pilus assembly protein TadD